MIEIMKWAFLLFLIYSIVMFNKGERKREGYQNWEACVVQGYPKDWCLFTPEPTLPAEGYCKCINGQYGSYSVDGKCQCYLFNPLLPQYIEPLFRDYLE